MLYAFAMLHMPDQRGNEEMNGFLPHPMLLS
jgi:hypothetical protein